jgi:hypothetical protein
MRVDPRGTGRRGRCRFAYGKTEYTKVRITAFVANCNNGRSDSKTLETFI